MDIENNPKRRMRCETPSKDNHYIYDVSIKFSDRTSSFAMSYKKEDTLDMSLVKVIGITSSQRYIDVLELLLLIYCDSVCHTVCHYMLNL